MTNNKVTFEQAIRGKDAKPLHLVSHDKAKIQKLFESY